MDSRSNVNRDWKSYSVPGATIRTLKNLGVNRFVVDSLIRLALHKLEYRIPDLFGEWLETIRSLTLSDFSSFKQTCEGSTIKGISLDTLEYVVGKIVTDPSIVKRNHAELTIDWANRAYSNSLAIHMLQAAREFAGSRDEDLGYHVECDANHLNQDSEIVIWLYDRSPDGNGSCKTIKQWMQIPKIVKDEFEASNDRTLPTQDFVDCLEGSYLGHALPPPIQLHMHVTKMRLIQRNCDMG